MSVLISTVISLGYLVKRNEWTAMKASGISIYRVALQLVLSGLLLSAFSFLLDNKLVSYGNEKRFDIDREYVKRKSRHKIKNTLKNLIFQKFFSWYPFNLEVFGIKLFELSVGVLPYPITFLITDIISEIFGKRKANQVVIMGIAASIFSIGLLLLGDVLPANSTSPIDDETFKDQRCTGLRPGSERFRWGLS